MDHYCELIELTASDLYEVSGGSRSRHKGSSIDIDIDIDFKVISKPTTTIQNQVDNSVNIG
jgi:hypothetical protein